MNEEVSSNRNGMNGDSQIEEYSYIQQIINNLPYIAMTLLGGAIFITGFADPVWGWICASAYVSYSVAGAFWIIIFVCPFCERHGTMCCPCGYGRVAARLRDKNDVSLFGRKFKRHIPVIVPLWFIPVIAGVVFAICFGMLKDRHDAEDMTQKTLLKGFIQIHRLRYAERFGAWIARIARNSCIDVIRS